MGKILYDFYSKQFPKDSKKIMSEIAKVTVALSQNEFAIDKSKEAKKYSFVIRRNQYIKKEVKSEMGKSILEFVNRGLFDF